MVRLQLKVVVLSISVSLNFTLILILSGSILPETNRTQQLKEISVIDKLKWMNFLSPEEAVFDGCDVKCTLNVVDKFSEVSGASDAVVIHEIGFDMRIPPERMNPDQVWIFAVWEAPRRTSSLIFAEPAWRNQINWTMSYRLDSTIPSPYGVVKKVKGFKRNYDKIMSQKKNLVAWVVSHCETFSKRENYVRLLEDTVQVDTFGSCGAAAPDDVFNQIKVTYKFYLSFENMLCKDYVSEKFFRTQNWQVVPIVRGDGNITHFYPKGSFIDTRDFKSPKALGQFLLYLDKNNTAYTKYLKAKENYIGMSYSRRRGFCKICSMLNSVDKHRHVYQNVHEWYTKDQCHAPSDLIEG